MLKHFVVCLVLSRGKIYWLLCSTNIFSGFIFAIAKNVTFFLVLVCSVPEFGEQILNLWRNANQCSKQISLQVPMVSIIFLTTGAFCEAVHEEHVESPEAVDDIPPWVTLHSIRGLCSAFFNVCGVVCTGLSTCLWLSIVLISLWSAINLASLSFELVGEQWWTESWLSMWSRSRPVRPVISEDVSTEQTSASILSSDCWSLSGSVSISTSIVLSFSPTSLRGASVKGTLCGRLSSFLAFLMLGGMLILFPVPWKLTLNLQNI